MKPLHLTIHLQRLSILTLLAALVFWAFFQWSKAPPVGPVNPFADDPVDAIGSIAIQVGWVCGLLALARGLRIRSEPERAFPRGGWIVNSAALTLLAIVVTLVADTLMEFLHPSWNVNVWGRALVVGLGVVAFMAVLLAVALVGATRSLKTVDKSLSAEEPGSLAGAMDDLWQVAKSLLGWLARKLPLLKRPLGWLARLGDRLFGWLLSTWISPQEHPWRFVLIAGLTVGIVLVLLGMLIEGLPPSPIIFLIVLAIFVGVETSAALLGFLLLGGLLGLRPPIRW